MQTIFEGQYVITQLSKRHCRRAFFSGVDELDTYLSKQAGQESRKNIAVTYVLAEEETNKVAAYYTLSATTVALQSLPEDAAKKLPHYPLVPATLIGRLAVDSYYQGQGLGETLLIDALHRAYQASTVVASFAVLVDALNVDAMNFYKKYGFLSLLNKKNQLYLPMKMIGKHLSG
jgi:ribosomal protein S18 acetylase RimI-like enzyme